MTQSDDSLNYLAKMTHRSLHTNHSQLDDITCAALWKKWAEKDGRKRRKEKEGMTVKERIMKGCSISILLLLIYVHGWRFSEELCGFFLQQLFLPLNSATITIRSSLFSIPWLPPSGSTSSSPSSSTSSSTSLVFSWLPFSFFLSIFPHSWLNF